MDPTADELIARLRRNPQDAAAFAALKAHYHGTGDYASLANLLEGWAARQQAGEAAAAAFYEAADLVLRHLGDYHRGINLCERAVDNNPAHPEAAVRLEQLLAEMGDYQRLVDLLEQRAAALAEGGDTREAAALHHRLGELWEHQLQRLDRAVFHYRKAFELDPSLVPAIYAAREIYRNAGNLKAAATLYDLEANAETDPARKVALLRELAHLRSEQLGELEGSIVALKRSLNLAPGDLGVMHDLATALLRRAEQLSDEEAAQTDRRRAADLLYQMAQSVPADHALAYCEAALDAVPDHDEALDLLEHLGEEHGRVDVLPLRWVAYLRVAPDAPSADERRRRLGYAYVEAGQLDDAVVCFEPLLDKNDAYAGEVLVDLYRRLGREEDLPRAVEVSVSTLPAEQRVAKLREAVQLLFDQGHRNAAMACAREILQLEPGDYEALEFLEQEYKTRGNYRELRDLMLAAARVPGLSVDSRKTRLREVAELSESELSDLDGAIGAWRAVAAIDPADSEARQALIRLLEHAERWDDLVQVLEREALALTYPEAKADLYARLAQVHRERRSDLAQAVEALRNLRELRPGDAEARDSLCDTLLEAGAVLEAIPLLRERIDAAGDRELRVSLLRTLGESLEEQVGDDDGAFEASARLLDEEPGDIEALDRMERIDLRSEHWERLLETLSYRAEVTPLQDRPELFRRMGRIADEQLGDLERAAEYYAQAVDSDRSHEGALDALCDIYDRAGRYRDLVVLLRERASMEDDAAARAELYRRIARTLSDRVRNAAGAAEAWREVLATGEDPEALAQLRRHAEAQDEPEELADLLGRLAAVTDDERQRGELLMQRAAVLTRRLERAGEAIEVLRQVLSDLRPDDPEALQQLADLCEQTGDAAGQADALERQLAARDEPQERLPVARQLADVYEHALSDRDGAIDALYAWCRADATDPAPRWRLARQLEQSERWSELIDVLDELPALETGDADIGEAVRRAARVAVEHLEDPEGAWRRLAPRVEKGDEEAEEALRELASETGRGKALAELYVRLAKTVDDTGEQRRRWVDASRAYEEYVDDAGSALEAHLRAFALDMSDEEMLAEVDRLANRAEAWQRLQQVYETLIRKAEDAEIKVRLLVRHAQLLDVKGAQPSEALDRTLRACALAPDDDTVLAYAEELAPRADRADELLIVYDRRRANAADDHQRVDALTRAAKLCDLQLDDRERALHYIAQGVALSARDPELLEPLERTIGELDVQRPDLPPGAAYHALIDIYRRLANDAEDDAAFGATLLRRAYRLHERELEDEDAAFEALKQATLLMPENVEILDELEELARRNALLEVLDDHLAQLVEEALDSKTAAELLRRRGRLLEEELQQFEKAAEVYAQLAPLVPADPDVSPRLRTCLQRAGRYQDLLVILDRELHRTEDDAERLQLLKEVALTWERDLKNRWEALDAWKKVLALAPEDPDASKAVQRLGHSTRRLTEDELAVGGGTVLERGTGPKPTSPLPGAEDGDPAAPIDAADLTSPGLDAADVDLEADEQAFNDETSDDLGRQLAALRAEDEPSADWASGAEPAAPDPPRGRSRRGEGTAELDIDDLEQQATASALPEREAPRRAEAAPVLEGTEPKPGFDEPEDEEIAIDVSDEELEEVSESALELPEDLLGASGDAANDDELEELDPNELESAELELESTELELVDDDASPPAPSSPPPPSSGSIPRRSSETSAPPPPPAKRGDGSERSGR